jgi:hypothetical protein
MSISRTFDITVKTPVGEQFGVFVFVAEGELLTGSLTTPKGTVDLTDGKIIGNKLDFFTKITTPMGKMKAHITGTVEDNQLTAVAKLPLGSAQIHGIRREEA